MKMALIPMLIATMFAVGTNASSRELLFGPEEVAKTKQPAKVESAKVKEKKSEAATKAEKKVAPTPEVKTAIAKPQMDELKSKSKPVATSEAKTHPSIGVPAKVVDTKPLVTAKPDIKLPEIKPSAPVAVAAAVVAPKIEVKTVEVKNFGSLKAQELTAKAPKVDPSEMSAPVTAAGGDPMTERRRLASFLKSEISIGFLPSATGNNDAFTFMVNYLPLANLMSADSGVLVNFAPERNLQKYRKNIAEAAYPMIFVDTALAKDAIEAGYLPVASGSEKLAAGYLVRKESKIQTVDDLKGAKIAWEKNAQITMLAMAQLTAKGLSKENTYQDVGSAGRAGALSSLKAGFADVAVLRSSEVEKIVSESAGAFRQVGTSQALPSSGFWVKKELVDHPLVARMTKSLLSVSPQASGPQKDASDGFSRGFGVKGSFDALSSDTSGFLKLIESAQKGFPEGFSQVNIDQKRKQANLQAPILNKLEMTKVADDAFVERKKLIANLKEGINLGFYVQGSSQNNFVFQSNFLPLANFISDKTNYLTTLIPESDPSAFAKRIVENEYAAIVISPSLAGAALLNGYIPAARAGEFVSSSLVVPVTSNVKKMSEASGMRIATVRGSDAATVGRWELLNESVKNIKFEYFGSFGETGSVLNSKIADAVLMRSTDAKDFVEKNKDEKNNPKFIQINGIYEVPAASLWIRHDVFDSAHMQSIAETFKNLSPTGEAAQKRAFDGYSKAFGFVHPWQQSGIEEHTVSVQMIEGLEKNKDSLFNVPSSNIAVVEKNRARSVTYPINAVKPSPAGNSKSKAGKS